MLTGVGGTLAVCTLISSVSLLMTAFGTSCYADGACHSSLSTPKPAVNQTGWFSSVLHSQSIFSVSHKKHP